MGELCSFSILESREAPERPLQKDQTLKTLKLLCMTLPCVSLEHRRIHREKVVDSRVRNKDRIQSDEGWMRSNETETDSVLSQQGLLQAF